MFANNEQDGAKGWVVGDSKENKFWFVQCGSVMGCTVSASVRVILLTRCISR